MPLPAPVTTAIFDVVMSRDPCASGAIRRRRL